MAMAVWRLNQTIGVPTVALLPRFREHVPTRNKQPSSLKQAAQLTQPQYGQSIPQQQQNQNEMGQLLLMIREHSQTMSNMQSQMVQLNNSC